MTQTELRKKLTDSLSGLYETEAVARLAELLQGEHRVLLYVYEHGDDEINPSTLSDVLHVSRARITTALTALRQKDFIKMEMCEEDRRRMRVILTLPGRQYIEAKQREVESHFDELIRGLGENNTMEFIRITRQSIELMKQANS